MPKLPSKPLNFSILIAVVFASLVLYYIAQHAGDSENSSEHFIDVIPSKNNSIPAGGQAETNDIPREKNGLPDPSEVYASIPESERITADKSELNFSSATNSFEALSAIDNAELEGLAVAKDWRVKLDTFCTNSASHQSEVEREWLQLRAADFCDGYSGSLDIPDLNANELHDLYDSTYEKTYEKDLVEKLQETNIPEQADLITSRLRNTRFPEEVDAIQSVINQYIGEAGFSPWNPLNLEKEPPHYYSSQNIALVMFSCLRFRSCGQNTIWFLQRCQMIPACGPSWNFDQIIYNLSTPLEYRTAMEIMAVLHGT